MNKPFILCVLAALAAFPQSQTPLTITQSAGSATGELRMQERRTNGQDYVGIRAPQSVAANTVWTLPSADGTSGQCLQTDGSGQWGWAACIINGGNTTGATLTIGTNDAQTLSLETNGTGRWSIPITGHLYAGANNTYDIGAGLAANSPRSIYAATSIVTPKIGRDTSDSLTIMTDSAERWIVNSAGMITPAATDTYDIGNLTTPLRVRGLYSKIVDTALAGGTGDYLQTRKIQLFDNTGSSTGASYWDLNVVMSGVGAGQNSYFYLRDNGGNTVWRADKIASGAAVATTTIYTDLLPDSTANTRDLGKTTQRWDEINGASLDLSGAANITGNLAAAVINATGSPAYRVSGTTVIDASRNLSNIGTGGFSGLITASAGVAFGASSTFAADATYDFGTSSTKLRRLYATGWTIYGSAFASSGSAITIQTGATFTDGRTCSSGDVWTADGSGNLACAAPAASSLPVADTTNVVKGSADATKLLRFEVDGFTTGTTRTLTPQNNSYTIAGTDIAQTFTQTQTFNGSTALVLNGNITGDLLFTTANVYIVGNGTNYLNNIHSETFTTYGRVKPASGVTTADLGAATTPFRKLWTGDISFTGTMTPPSGTAFSGTKTVRASGGASDCTLTFSAGIMTGGTC